MKLLPAIVLLSFSTLLVAASNEGQGPQSVQEMQQAAQNSLNHLVWATQAYNALPDEVRLPSGKRSVRGAYEVLLAHANKHPNLVLDDELSVNMEWALVFSENGMLRSAPLLNKLVDENIALAATQKAQRTAQHLASVFNAAMATGSKELEHVTTIDEAVTRLTTGVMGGGAFADKKFIVKATPDQTRAAMPYLTLDTKEGMLHYSKVPTEEATVVSSKEADAADAIEMLAKMVEPKQNTKAVTSNHSAKAQRVAQSAASIFNAAMATGTKAFDDVTTLEEVMTRLNTGVKGGGAFSDRTFMCPIKPEEALAAAPYLKLDVENKMLVYTAEPTIPVASSPTAPAPTPTQKKANDPISAARRNAQSIYSTYLSARTGGCKTLADAKSVEDIQEMLSQGVTGDGAWQKTRFNVVMSEKDMKAASAYLKLDALYGLTYLE